MRFSDVFRIIRKTDVYLEVDSEDWAAFIEEFRSHFFPEGEGFLFGGGSFGGGGAAGPFAVKEAPRERRRLFIIEGET